MFNVNKIPENNNFTVVKYGVKFHGRHIALTPAVVKKYIF